jgi:hypothetical protein
MFAYPKYLCRVFLALILGKTEVFSIFLACLFCRLTSTHTSTPYPTMQTVNPTTSEIAPTHVSSRDVISLKMR